MTNLKKNGKKGFTLAELLIVVAIIAVLTAIAVPLFVGALNNAEDSVKDANIRAVRSQAVSKILLAKEPTGAIDTTENDPAGIYTRTGSKAGEYAWKLQGPWYVTAYVTASGEVKNLTINTTTSVTTACVEATSDDKKTVSDAKYKVTLVLNVDNLTNA